MASMIQEEVPEISVQEKLKEYKKYFQLFVWNGQQMTAKRVFKNIFCSSVERAIKAHAKFETDPEIQGLIVIGYDVFPLNVGATLVAAVYKEFGDEGIIGQRMIDSETH